MVYKIDLVVKVLQYFQGHILKYKAISFIFVAAILQENRYKNGGSLECVDIIWPCQESQSLRPMEE